MVNFQRDRVSRQYQRFVAPFESSLRGPRQTFVILSLVIFFVSTAESDETHERYFEQLRQRGLFSLAEAEAISRLAADDLSLAGRTSFSIELSRTLSEHAGFVLDEQRDELWQRARSVVQDLLDRERVNPRSILLNGQLASVSVAEGDWLRAERELRPFDEQILNRARTACLKAIERLQTLDKLLAEPPRDSSVKKSAPGSPAGHELRTLLHQVRWQLGQSFRNLAELAPPGSDERTTDVMNAEQSLRRLIGVADEPVQSRAKVLLVACSRLKGELDRASEMLAALEKSEPRPSDSVFDEMTAERVRLLMELRRPADAAELLVKARSKRQRLTGELWLLQIRSLIELRNIALDKQQESLADRLSKQINTTIERCEEQVGGFWSRRCQQSWDNAQTTRKYGVELDSLMQQARMDFTAGRIEVALAEYASAERAAAKNGQLDLAMELGFTRASIQLDQKQFESSAAEFFRLANEYMKHALTAKAHLLGTYSLGRIYDEKKTQQHREDYTEALDRHLKNYSRDSTVNDARYLKAQLEEQRLQATQALPLYLQVETGHVRAPEAMSGAARCYETILRRMNERNLATDDLEREAIDRLSKYLSETGDPIETWNVTHADVALRLAAILLMGSSNRWIPGAPVASRLNGLEKPFEPNNSVRCMQAEQWLSQVTSFTERQDSETAFAEAAELLRQRIAPLHIVALAGRGNIVEAERVLSTLSASPSKMLLVFGRLTQFVAATNPAERAPLATLQLSVAKRLIPLQDQLSPDEREQFDRCLATTYIAAGQFAKAVELVKKLANLSPKDINKQRELAQLLAEANDPDAQSLTRQCWRRVESLTKSGSVEWLSARLAVLRACVRLNQFEEGRKLLQVTRLLYPDLGGEILKTQFETIDEELRIAGKKTQ